MTKKEKLILLTLTILFISASLSTFFYPIYNIDLLRALRIIGILISIGILFLLSNFSDLSLKKNNLYILCLWIMFCVLLLISSLYHNELQSVLGSIWLLLFIPLIFYYVIPNTLINKPNELLTKSLFSSYIIFIIISILLNSNFSYPYSGIFPNPNQLGTYAAISSVFFFVALTNVRQYKFIYILGLVLVFTLIILSGSRTSLLSFLILFAVFFYLKTSSSNKILYLFAPLLIIIFLLWMDFSLLNISLSGREEIWGQALAEGSIFGHGSNYFVEVVNFSSHNSIIKILGENGYIAAIIFILVMIFTIIESYKYFKNNKNIYYSSAPLFITLSFWSISFGENLFSFLGKGIMLAYLISIGIIMRDLKLRRSGEKMK